jgi:hypothetical protein
MRNRNQVGVALDTKQNTRSGHFEDGKEQALVTLALGRQRAELASGR